MPRDMIEIEVEPATPEQRRAKWISELRKQGHRQCVGPFLRGGKVCAIYLLHEMYPSKHRPWSPLQAALDVGLSLDQAAEIAMRNDTGETFAEIADVMEGWFK